MNIEATTTLEDAKAELAWATRIYERAIDRGAKRAVLDELRDVVNEARRQVELESAPTVEPVPTALVAAYDAARQELNQVFQKLNTSHGVGFQADLDSGWKPADENLADVISYVLSRRAQVERAEALAKELAGLLAQGAELESSKHAVAMGAYRSARREELTRAAAAEKVAA